MQALAGGHESYYLREVAQGAEEYYTERGEVPGRWLGSAAGRLGLAGEVDAVDLRTLLRGVDPSTGEQIARNNRKVAALDLTLSAPKSVSLLWAFGDAETAGAVIAAHDCAVDAALEYLEREAIRARRGKAGVEVIDGDGLIAAAFRHRTSRLGDPQLHTHVLAANATRCPDDGVWRALHGKVLFWHARTAGHLYQAELRRGLTAALGVEWTPTVKGCAEVAGIPDKVIEAFSQRRGQIERHMARTGDTSIMGARRAAIATRPAKVHQIDYQELRADWARRADLHDFGVELVQDLVRPQRDPARDPARPPIDVDDAFLSAELTERDSLFDRRHVIQAVANHARPTAMAADIEHRADEFLASRHAVALGVAITGVQYSTAELIEIERHLVERAEARIDHHVAVCKHADEGIAAFPPLSAEQRLMVETITTDGSGISVVVGAAGTGKTYALETARELWEAEGYVVIGCSLAARAAAELQAGAGIPSCSLDRLLTELDRTAGLGSGTVVVVDEAAMIGTRKLARLLDHANEAEAKVVLVGDHHQLPEIEAGGAFAALAQRLGAVTLTQNRRQRDPTEVEALAELRDGAVGSAIGLLDASGRIHHHADRDTARDQMVGDWLDAVLDDGRDAIMLATTRVDVDDLNRRARDRLVAEGGIDRSSIAAGEREFAAGDWVMTTRNDYRLGLLNGRTGVVVDVDQRRRALTVSFDGEGPALIPASYLDAGSLDYAYAMTVHKAQGHTCDVALVLGDDHLYREAGYTALTRGRYANHLYVADEEADIEAHAPPELDESTTLIGRALARSEQQTLASGIIDLRLLPPRPDTEITAVPVDDLGVEL